ncbi:MAG: hypothetical protein ABIN36_02360 [Ferruginibacter sp.]
MKKTLFAALFALSVSSLFANSLAPGSSHLNYRSDIVNASKNVDIVLGSANGSTVHIVSNATFSQAGVSAFSGTVTISGRQTTGTIAFAIDGKELRMVFNSPDLTRLTKIKWVGDSRSTGHISILNETGINNSLVSLFRTFA